MKYILSVLFLFFFFSGFTQIYQEMPQYGYRANRMAFDSTLQIPTVCGVPTLKSVVSVNRKAAIAFDSCNNKFYSYNPKTLTWSEVSGGGNPTFQNVIDNGNLITKNDTIKFNEQTRLNFTGKASGNQTYSLLDIYNGNTGGIIDMKQFSNPLQQIFFSPNFTYLNNDDISISTSTGLNIINGDINMVDDNKINFLNTSGAYYNSLISDANNDVSDKLHHLPNLYQVYDDTLATTADIRNSTIDTANKWVNNIYRTSGVDSIYYTIGSTTYAIKDSAGGGSSQNGRFGNDTATVVMAKVHNNSGSTLTNGKVVFLATSGTNSDAPSVRLANNKADSTSANTFGFVSGSIANNDTGWVILSGKIEKLNTSAYSNGDIIYLDSVSGNWTKTKPVAPYHMVYLGVVVKSNAGNGSIFVKCQNGYELDEIHDVQITSKQNNQVLAYSDTQKVWKNRNIYSIVDTTNLIATKTNVAAKVNISDTSTMLTPYIRLAGTGLTKSSQTLSNNLSTGVAGGQSVVGGTAASENLTLSSTTNATKGKILFGTSAYDEVNNRLGIGTASPATTVNVIGSTGYNALRIGDGTGYINQQYNRGATGSWLTQTTTASTGIMFEYSHATNPGFNFLVPGIVAMGLGMDNAGMFMSNTTSSYPGTTLMKIFNGGNIAIGTSTNAGYKLDVNGTARAVTSIESPIHYGNSTASGTLTLGSTSNATKGKILFGTSAYDEVNNRLGIGLTSPTAQLDVVGTGKISTTDNSYNQQLVIENKSTGTTALTGIVLQYGSSSSLVGQMTYVPSNYITASLQNTLLFSSAGQQKLAFVANGSGSGGVAQDMYFSTLGTNSTYQMQIKGNTGNVQIGTNTDAGYKFDVNGTARVQGALNFNPTNTAAGTTGNQTINKASGTVNIAAAGTTVTVTNNLVTASSIVFAVIRTNDATATIKNVVPASGSFTINLNAATTAETSIGFFVIN